MLRLVVCEFSKLKRKKLFLFAFLTTFLMPFFYSMLLKDWDLDDMMAVVREDNGFLLLIPLSVVAAANLFFEEHDHDTLKNLMCIPVSKTQLAIAKIFILLLFDLGYMLAGYAVAMLMAIISGVPTDRWGLQLFLTFCTGILLWAAAMPCLLLVVWCNKSYIISVIIAFAYTVLGYILHISDAVIMMPLGLNVPTFLPIPMIFRWLYQYYDMEGAGGELLAFYQRFQPYFVPTPVVFAVMLAEAVVCITVLVKIYQRQTN